MLEVMGSKGIIWNVAELSGESMPVLYWPRNRDLPINVSCVGIIAGGTDSMGLGRWEDSISPERWTGIPIGGGVAGSYEFAFRITRADGGRRGIPLWLDPDMTPPTNVRLDDRRISLRWDYNPRPGEEPIDGFRIYLNGGLQWVEPADSRESMLPYEWFNPLAANFEGAQVAAAFQPDSAQEVIQFFQGNAGRDFEMQPVLGGGGSLRLQGKETLGLAFARLFMGGGISPGGG